MKHREKRFESNHKPSKLLNIMSRLAVVAVLCFWIFREKLGISTPDLFILTGIAVFMISLSLSNRSKYKGINVSDNHLKRNRDNIGSGDYNGDVYYNRKR